MSLNHSACWNKTFGADTVPVVKPLSIGKKSVNVCIKCVNSSAELLEHILVSILVSVLNTIHHRILA